MRFKRSQSALALAALAALSLAACAAPGSNNASTDNATTTDVVTDISSLGDVTLTVWDQEVRGTQDDQFSTLIKDFEKKYPNVTIKRNAQAFDDYTKTVALAMSDAEPPDVIQANNGRSDMGAFVKAGQLTDLAPWNEAYGWSDRFPQTVLKNSSYSADGKLFGEGNLYGVPQMGEIVGVFYNKAKLAALGLSVPTDWQGFLDALAAAKAGGEVPLVLGNQEGWPAGHVLGPIQGVYVPTDEVVDLNLGNPGRSWNTAQNLQAVTELQRWIAAGYFNEGVNGIDDQQAAKKFMAGEGVFMMAGSWNSAALDAEMGDNAGFFAPPPLKAGDPIATTGGTSLPFAIPAKSDAKDVAAAFIDFITSEEAMKTLAEAGNLPVLNAGTLVTSGVNGEVATAFESVSTTGTLLPYMDWATPTFSDDALVPRLQDLFADKIQPQGVIDAFQKNYADFTG